MKLYIVLMLITATALAQEQQMSGEQLQTQEQEQEQRYCTVCWKACVQKELNCMFKKCPFGKKKFSVKNCRNACSDSPEVARCIFGCSQRCPRQTVSR